MRRYLPALATVAAMLAFSIAADAAGSGPVKGGHYTGTTGPGYPLSFNVSANGKTVEHLVVSLIPTCSPGAGDFPFKFHFDPAPIHNDSFSAHDTIGAGSNVEESLHITAEFSGHKLSGEVTNRSAIKSLKPCTEEDAVTGMVAGDS